MAQLVNETYAQALFDAALDLDLLVAVYEDFSGVVATFRKEQAFYELYRTPKIDKTEKKRIIDTVFANHTQQVLINFLKVLIDKRRTFHVLGIFESFEALYRDHFKIQKATVKTVTPLTEAQVQQLAGNLEKITGAKVEIDNVIDPSIMGGMLVQIGDQILDSSLKRKLEGLKDSLAQISL